jgi:hypothetical protein
MRDFEPGSGPVPGGDGRGGGAFYHVSFRSGSRAGGACARAAHDYIARENEYAGPDRDAALHTESGHMPSWAEDHPGAYWDAADLYERANGRLYVSGDFALPRGLSTEDQVEIAREFVHALTDREKLPYTFAVHAGADADGQEHNPHVHVMISERQNDGIERNERDWFRRANREQPERGGAAKSRGFHGRQWVERAREKIADVINDKLRELGRDERVDHRSYARQGVDREPGEHFGPHAPHMVQRGHTHDRLEEAAGLQDYPDRIAHIEGEIGDLERLRDQLAHEEDSPDPGPADRSNSSYGPGYTRDDDSSRGRW